MSDFEKIKDILNEPFRNLCQSFYDDFVEINARTKAKMGVKAIISRRELYNCCEWCKSLAGTYIYGNEPADIYRRHDNCRCMVTVRSEKDKTYQDAWSKREFRTQREARKAREKEIRYETAENSVYKEYLKKAAPGKGIIKFDTGYENSKHRNEIETAKKLKQRFGGDIVLLNEKNEVKTPDYLWNGELWELKRVSSLNSTDKQMQKAIKQIHENPGGIIIQIIGDKASPQEIVREIKKRASRSGTSIKFDVIIEKDEKIVDIIRFK